MPAETSALSELPRWSVADVHESLDARSFTDSLEQIGADISRKLHLHARTLILQHPITQKMVTLTAPLPAHMQRTWDFVGWDVTHAPLDPFNMPDA